MCRINICLVMCCYGAVTCFYCEATGFDGEATGFDNEVILGDACRRRAHSMHSL